MTKSSFSFGFDANEPAFLAAEQYAFESRRIAPVRPMLGSRRGAARGFDQGLEGPGQVAGHKDGLMLLCSHSVLGHPFPPGTTFQVVQRRDSLVEPSYHHAQVVYIRPVRVYRLPDFLDQRRIGRLPGLGRTEACQVVGDAPCLEILLPITDIVVHLMTGLMDDSIAGRKPGRCTASARAATTVSMGAILAQAMAWKVSGVRHRGSTWAWSSMAMPDTCSLAKRSYWSQNAECESKVVR